MNSMLGFADWSVVGLYVLVVAFLSIQSKFGRRQDADEYLVAGRSMNWIIVGLAVFATLFSTISFVSIPGEAYNFGMGLMVLNAGQILFLPLGIHLFLRFFFAAPTFTAYEYLERRYNRPCRMIAATIFILIRLFYSGGVFYAAAIIFESLAGWPPLLTVVVIGSFTIVYTLIGGVRAVIMADVIQSVIIICSIGAILFRLLQVTGFDFGAVLEFAHAHDKTFEIFSNPEFFRLDVHDRWNFYLLIYGLILTPLMTMSCDQLVIQRLLAGKNYREAVRSCYTNYLLSIPVVGMLYLIGVFLFFYYNSGAAVLPEGIRGDQVLGYFINHELPAPLPGLIVTALLAALMSTVAGVINSLVTVFFKDVVSPLRPLLVGTPKEICFCRILTVVCGILALAVTLLMLILGQGVRTTLMEVIGVWSNLWPILFVAFLYGVLSETVSAKAILITLTIGGVINMVLPYLMYYVLPEGERWGFQWLGLPGLVVSLILPPLLSRLWPNRQKLDGLTLKTIEKNFDREP